MTDRPAKRVLQMRLVVEAADYEEALRFYRDVLGADVELQVHGEGGEMVTILDVGRATLELSNPAQVEMMSPETIDLFPEESDRANDERLNARIRSIQ